MAATLWTELTVAPSVHTEMTAASTPWIETSVSATPYSKGIAKGQKITGRSLFAMAIPMEHAEAFSDATASWVEISG